MGSLELRVRRPAGLRSAGPGFLRTASVAVAVVLVGVLLVGAFAREGEVTWLPFAIEVAVGLAMIAAGHVGWTKRPESRIGPLLVIAGLLHLAWELTETPWPATFTLGFLVSFGSTYVLAHAMLTFPTGRSAPGVERATVVAFYALGAGLLLMRLLIDTSKECAGCPRNLALIADAPTVAEAILRVMSVGLLGFSGAFFVVVVRKWRAGSPAARRALTPILAVGASAGLLGVTEGVMQAWFLSAYDPHFWFWFERILLLAAPLAFLEGLLRTRMSRAAVGELVVELGGARIPEGGLREALARRLGDPSLQIAYFRPEREDYVDERGHPMTLPAVGSGRAVTLLESAGEPIAALVHDEFLRHDPEIVEAVAAAARLAISNERLRAEVRAQLEEVRASRARIVEAGDAGRRRVERNLHDGAQQRLVTLSLALGMLREQLDHDSDPGMVAQLGAISDEVRETIEDLRELARGIHPVILTEAGLSAGVESLAERSPVPVWIEGPPIDRLPEPVEVAAYFVVAEALTNVAKYSHAKRVSVRLSRRGRSLEVDVVDDGVGGADPADGSGLRGIEDRVAAMGGVFRLESKAGAGTLVHAEIPCDGR
ncbi:MAG: sensor histidine kinase [Actinomycetota bacterium]